MSASDDRTGNVDSLGRFLAEIGCYPLLTRDQETILAEYLDHYNAARPHRDLKLSPPRPTTTTTNLTGSIRRRDVVGGLIHEYELVA